VSRFWGARAERTLGGLRAFFAAEPSSRQTADASATQAEAQLLGLFRSAAEEVPAYRRFLAQHSIDPSTVTDLTTFAGLPATTKDNYYRQHPLPDLCRHGQLDSCDMVALSSGSTGEPAVWPRFVTDELETSARFEQVLDAFSARERPTLAVICFALGNWVGGMYTLGCCRHLAAKGYPLTVVAPGNQPGEILRALRALSPHFEQRVLFGYPPFLRDVLELGKSQGIDWSSPPTRLVMAGEVFSEEWRDWVCRLTGASDPARSTASLYGTADGGVLANETPLSIRIRRALARRPAVARAIFGEARLPTLCQYDPRHRYFEVEEGGWLLFSGNGGAPLLRYKILDRGGVLPHAEMLRLLAEHQIELEPDDAGTSPELPFVYVFGRSHFAVSFYGANVYPENISVGLEQPELAPSLTGKFVVEVRYDSAQASELTLCVELTREASATPGLVAQIQRLVRQQLELQNSEFASYVPEARRTAQVELRPFADPDYFPTGVKHRYTR
jgi:phenylacetate-CoA ligase